MMEIKITGRNAGDVLRMECCRGVLKRRTGGLVFLIETVDGTDTAKCGNVIVTESERSPTGSVLPF